MLYVVEKMTNNDYDRFKCGYNNYAFEKIVVEANSVEEAIEQVREVGYVINESYVKTVEELKEEERILEEKRKEREKKEEEKKERAINREKANAEKMGLSLKEYKSYKRAIANKKRHIREFNKAKEAMEFEAKKIEEYEKKIAKFEKNF